jgi:hypothetical protein
MRDGTRVSGRHAFVSHARQVGREHRATEEAWVEALRAVGVKAAHPDDGWVDRKDNRVHLAYPQFNDGLGLGDWLALGHPGDMRIVRVIGMEPNPFAIGPDRERWYFRFDAAERWLIVPD